MTATAAGFAFLLGRVFGLRFAWFPRCVGNQRSVGRVGTPGCSDFGRGVNQNLLSLIALRYSPQKSSTSAAVSLKDLANLRAAINPLADELVFIAS